eukprot:scaffold25479_cov76-Skeletonema_dohrnii-CCMP3373.AAC.1
MIEVPGRLEDVYLRMAGEGVCAGTSTPSIMTTKAAENEGPQQSIWRSKERWDKDHLVRVFASAAATNLHGRKACPFDTLHKRNLFPAGPMIDNQSTMTLTVKNNSIGPTPYRSVSPYKHMPRTSDYIIASSVKKGSRQHSLGSFCSYLLMQRHGV